MTVYIDSISLKTVSDRPSYHDITKEVNKIVQDSKIKNGLCVVSSPHTTCSVYFEEYMHDKNYYGDEYLQVDLNNILEKIIPRERSENQYNSPGPEHIKYGMAKVDPDYPAEKWTMLNTDAHLRSTLLGSSETFILKNGELLIGKVGYVYFVDFDQTRERNRTCNVLVMGEMD
ncbi:YjbQ family protein [Heyndrickxia acidiproducens]|uniref:YjbQ family protein n=1 Tax=Heyndrickxia acidiproducens TaxID=1121084 RepID=UPI00036840A8|nr:YjbQ family protein [Heyndrickxia acidiproducens]